MLREIRFENWKSFKQATLYLDPLTVLIGTNASGKANTLDGLHPSRSELMVKMLKEVGRSREIDILVTTHNPALLDTLGPEMVPFIVVAYRDRDTGQSRLTLLEDIDALPKLLASGTVGKLTTQGRIEASLRGLPSEKQ